LKVYGSPVLSQCSYSLLSDSEPNQQHLHPQSATAATPISTRPKGRKKPPKARKGKEKSPVAILPNVTMTEMGDAVEINISSSDDGVVMRGASVSRNDAGDEMDVNDPRSTLGQIDNTPLCMSDSTSSTSKKVSVCTCIRACVCVCVYVYFMCVVK